MLWFRYRVIGTCGSCHQGRLHVPCDSKCGKTLICGHMCREPCSEICPPCQRKCDNACPHSQCHSKCGEPCPPCVELCNRQCTHQKCTALCFQKCTQGPCSRPCPRKLKCKHPCIGFCTDQCPNKCRTCLGDEKLPDVLLGTENEDSRYVQLDCGHVIEAEGMDMWVNTCLESKEISMGGISCPACKAPVKKCNRYRLHVNAKRQLIEEVKKKVSWAWSFLKKGTSLYLLISANIVQNLITVKQIVVFRKININVYFVWWLWQ